MVATQKPDQTPVVRVTDRNPATDPPAVVVSSPVMGDKLDPEPRYFRVDDRREYELVADFRALRYYERCLKSYEVENVDELGLHDHLLAWAYAYTAGDRRKQMRAAKTREERELHQITFEEFEALMPRKSADVAERFAPVQELFLEAQDIKLEDILPGNSDGAE